MRTQKVESSFVISADKLRAKFIVYCLWENQECIYVGMSTKGLARPLTNTLLKPHWDTCSHLIVRVCTSAEMAAIVERDLIIKYKPHLNKMMNPKENNPEPVSNPLETQTL